MPEFLNGIEFKREEIPSDMKQLISNLDLFRSGAATLIT